MAERRRHHTRPRYVSDNVIVRDMVESTAAVSQPLVRQCRATDCSIQKAETSHETSCDNVEPLTVVSRRRRHHTRPRYVSDNVIVRDMAESTAAVSQLLVRQCRATDCSIQKAETSHETSICKMRRHHTRPRYVSDNMIVRDMAESTAAVSQPLVRQCRATDCSIQKAETSHKTSCGNVEPLTVVSRRRRHHTRPRYVSDNVIVRDMVESTAAVSQPLVRRCRATHCSIQKAETSHETSCGNVEPLTVVSRRRRHHTRPRYVSDNVIVRDMAESTAAVSQPLVRQCRATDCSIQKAETSHETSICKRRRHHTRPRYVSDNVIVRDMAESTAAVSQPLVRQCRATDCSIQKTETSYETSIISRRRRHHTRPRYVTDNVIVRDMVESTAAVSQPLVQRLRANGCSIQKAEASHETSCDNVEPLTVVSRRRRHHTRPRYVSDNVIVRDMAESIAAPLTVVSRRRRHHTRPRYVSDNVIVRDMVGSTAAPLTVVSRRRRHHTRPRYVSDNVIVRDMAESIATVSHPLVRQLSRRRRHHTRPRHVSDNVIVRDMVESTAAVRQPLVRQLSRRRRHHTRLRYVSDNVIVRDMVESTAAYPEDRRRRHHTRPRYVSDNVIVRDMAESTAAISNVLRYATRPAPPLPATHPHCFLPHLTSDAVADFNSEIWSHVRLKGSKNSRQRRTKMLKTNPPHRFNIGDTDYKKCTIECTTMLTNTIPKHGGATEFSTPPHQPFTL
ncbi:hypothetical protein J6590_002951 [Homalodisca vitripennis]|nr:hypothetical protein J6590_002951 [Homalodisca vitripennis]